MSSAPSRVEWKTIHMFWLPVMSTAGFRFSPKDSVSLNGSLFWGNPVHRLSGSVSWKEASRTAFALEMSEASVSPLGMLDRMPS